MMNTTRPPSTLDNASRLFRERGFDGIALNDLMQSAGLTRGGFYGHFESKDDLAAQASRRALAANLEQWHKLVETGLADWVKAYLSDAHSRSRAEGCGLAALAGDAARGGPAVQAAFGEGIEAFATALQPLMPGPTDADRREQAWLAWPRWWGACCCHAP
jgi:TetR/AcrR family transcriptional repressor of nem operon